TANHHDMVVIGRPAHGTIHLHVTSIHSQCRLMFRLDSAPAAARYRRNTIQMTDLACDCHEIHGCVLVLENLAMRSIKDGPGGSWHFPRSEARVTVGRTAGP